MLYLTEESFKLLLKNLEDLETAEEVEGKDDEEIDYDGFYVQTEEQLRAYNERVEDKELGIICDFVAEAEVINIIDVEADEEYHIEEGAILLVLENDGSITLLKQT